MLSQAASGPECFLTEVARKNDPIQVIGLNVISNGYNLPFFSTNFARIGFSHYSFPIGDHILTPLHH